MIPKTLHVIWVGDESKRPDNCISTWAEHNPDWQVKIWGNDLLAETDWINTDHMRAMSTREFNGVADMMRWEILYREGGFVVDADSICIRPLDDALLDRVAFSCWESEIARPGLIAAGYVACNAGNPFIGQIIEDIRNAPSVVNDMAWKTVGPQRLTDAFRRYAYHDLDILPSHYFIPEHFTGSRYDGTGIVYAHQEWASTKKIYDTLHLKKFDANGRTVHAPAPTAAPSTVQARAPAPAKSPLEGLHEPYFVQKVNVGRDLIGRSRLDVFAQLCRGKRVLHMGCADWPITDTKTSLHLALEPHCVRLDGFDIHEEALAALRPHAKGQLFSRLEDVTQAYDLILVPEVLEHVPDVAGFLAQLNAIQAPHIVMTVPDALQCRQRHFDFVEATETVVEIVHPDHNCWYTPYTLSNVIAKYTGWHIDGMWFFNGISLLAVISKKTPN
ncbi:MAG: mannosyltransferase [Betaproteobacteria bacterium]|nr:mannosyltransferase [Betaproteobacteria bacterium]